MLLSTKELADLKSVTEAAQEREKSLSDPTSCLSVHSDDTSIMTEFDVPNITTNYISDISMSKSRGAVVPQSALVQNHKQLLIKNEHSVPMTMSEPSYYDGETERHNFQNEALPLYLMKYLGAENKKPTL